MDRLKSRRCYVKKAGWQVPRHILDMLAMRHPTVEILWEARVKRWALVQTIGGITQLLRFLRHGESPTLANTVYHVDSLQRDLYSLRTKWGQERFLQKMDANPAAIAAERRARDAIRVGSSDLYDQMTNRRVIAVRPR